MISGFSSDHAHIDFELIDSTLNNGADFVSAIPFFGITLNAREHKHIHVFISACSPAMNSRTVGHSAATDPAVVIMHFRPSPFNAVSTSLFFCNTMIRHDK